MTQHFRSTQCVDAVQFDGSEQSARAIAALTDSACTVTYRSGGRDTSFGTRNGKIARDLSGRVGDWVVQPTDLISPEFILSDDEFRLQFQLWPRTGETISGDVSAFVPGPVASSSAIMP